MADFNVEFTIDDKTYNLHETKILVDDELSAASENPVQNKVITGEINDLKQELDQYEGIFTADVDESVQNWLDAHPEATTTVQDWSLEYDKLTKGTLGFVIPEMFGAKGDGTTNDYNSFALFSNSWVLHISLSPIPYL